MAEENIAKSKDTTMSEAPQTPTHQAHGNSQPLVAEGITPSTTQKRKVSPLERFTPPKTIKPPLEEDAPIIDGSVFEAFGFPTPTNHCVLSIYEQSGIRGTACESEQRTAFSCRWERHHQEDS